MKTFKIITARSGMIFEVGVNEDPQVQEYLDDYIKELEITSLKVDETEIPKNKDGRLFFVKFSFVPYQGESKLVIQVKYDAYKFIQKLKGIPTKQDNAAILCSKELSDYYSNVYLPAVETKIAQLKAEKISKIQAVFDALTDDSIIEIHYNTSTNYSVRGAYGGHEWFKTCFRDMKCADIEIPGNYMINCDWGDYSISKQYKIPFSELKKLYQAAREILEPQEKKAAEEKAAREALRASLKCEILKKGKTQGEEWDPYALVKLTDPATGESLEFNCRNVFDFGYIVNPNYAVVPGAKGGIAYQGKWDCGQVEGRELTNFEKHCLEYLHEFPPVSSGIRM